MGACASCAASGTTSEEVYRVEVVSSKREPDASSKAEKEEPVVSVKATMEADEEEDEMRNFPFTLHETLGSGQFAEVRIGKHKGTGETVAVKVVEKRDLKSESVAKVSPGARIFLLWLNCGGVCVFVRPRSPYYIG